ncbi:MAG: DUF748 domain-containing protein [Mariniphaga sp.]|nr:DUF748 domain-containing protein [Mariniphaga sp.]
MKKAVKIIVFFVIPALIALVIFALVALPPVAKNYINKHGKEYTGRKLSVDQIRINYFTSTFHVIGFTMFEADEQAPFVAFDSLTVDINPLRLFSSELDIEKFRIVKPEVTITQQDSVFNFDDIIAFINSKPKTDTVSKPSGPFKYVMKNISLAGGKLTYNDKGINYTNIMSNLGFVIPYISYNREEISEAGLKFYFENGGFLQALAGYNQKLGAYNADLTVSKLDISPFLPYMKPYFRFKSYEGIADGKFHIQGNINNLDSMMIRGDANVADFALKDLSDRKVLGAAKGNVTMANSYPMKYVFNFDKITLTEPYLFFEMKDSTNNFLNLMVDDTVSSAGSSSEPFEYYYRVNHFKIDKGLVDFRDNTYGEPFDYHLDEIALKVDSISSVNKWITAYSTARLNKRGKLKAELGINPSDPYELKVNYVVTNFQLSDLNIISRYYVGFPFLLGNMYYEGKTTITARQLTSENKLIVRNAKLGKKSKGLMNIPLKLALYLLKDVHGDIILDLPLSGDLNDPKTKIGRLVWQVFKNVIVKVVSSPFRALSGLMGVDPDEIKGVEFNYSDTILTNSHLRRVKLFTELAKKKPDMNIEIAYYNDAELEKQAIAVEEAGKLFKAATGTDYRKEKDLFTAFIAKKLQSDTMNMIAGSVQMIGNQKLDSIQNSFAQKRISKLEAALHAADDSTRIKVLIPNKEVPENVGSRPVFELKFSIDE